MDTSQAIYELTIRGLKRTIVNILVNDTKAFEAYYYNYLFRVAWHGNKIVASVKSPGAEVIANLEYPSKSQRPIAIKKCVERILDHYSQIHTKSKT